MPLIFTMMGKIILAFLLFVSLTIHAQTTYYIDPAGSDATGNGTIGNSWKSLYKACETVKTSCDIIHINAGTFVETRESSLHVGVSIEGEGVKSILHSDVTSAYGCLIRLSSGTENTNGNQHISNVKFQSSVTDTYCAIWLIARGNVEIYNCIFENFKDWGIRLRGGINGDGEPTTYALNNKIYNCTFSNCASYQLHSGGRANISISGQEGLLIHDCTIIQTARTVGVDNGVGIKAVPGFTKGLKIYNNTITCDPYSDTENANGNCYAFSIELWDGQGTEIYNNNLYNGAVDIGGYYEKKGTYDYSVSLHDNFIGRTALTDLGSIGIIIEASKELSDVLIYNNLIKNVNKGIYWTPLNNVSYQNVQIYYNVFDQIGMNKDGNTAYTWAIQAYTDSKTGYIFSNWKIQNNVFIASSRVGGYQYSAIILPNKSDATVDHIYIQNNIMQGWDFTPIYIRNDVSGAIDYLWIQNNLYYANGNSNKPKINITPTHYTASGDIVANPVFVSTSDYHLQTGSPAIGKGVHIADLTTDHDGNIVGNPPEIGAYEFINGDNHPPSIKDQGFQLNGNSPGGTAVGTVVASDLDARQTLTYSIVSGNANGAFAIDALTGVLSVANSAALNVDFALVVKVQDNGVGELSSQAILAIDVIPTGIELTGNNGAIKVYPNPVSSELFIEYKGNKERLIFNILNSVGQIVFNGNLTEKAVVQTTSFSPGVYLMKIADGRSFEFRKIIKV